MLKCGHADKTLPLKNRAVSMTVTIKSEEQGAK
jgi:hypothetical protein